jgi:hypothetical protein
MFLTKASVVFSSTPIDLNIQKATLAIRKEFPKAATTDIYGFPKTARDEFCCKFLNKVASDF